MPPKDGTRRAWWLQGAAFPDQLGNDSILYSLELMSIGSGREAGSHTKCLGHAHSGIFCGGPPDSIGTLPCTVGSVPGDPTDSFWVDRYRVEVGSQARGPGPQSSPPNSDAQRPVVLWNWAGYLITPNRSFFLCDTETITWPRHTVIMRMTRDFVWEVTQPNACMKTLGLSLWNASASHAPSV